MSKKGPKKVVPKWLQDYRDGKPRFVVEENPYGIFTYASSEEVTAEHKVADTALRERECATSVFERPLTREDFDRCRWEEVIAASPKKDCQEYSSLFLARASKARKDEDYVADAVFSVLFVVTDVHLDPDNLHQPFGPRFVAMAARGTIPEDLKDQHYAILAGLAPTVADPEMRARLCDLLWVVKRNYQMAKAAVPAYLESARTLEDGDNWPPCAYRIRRVVRLARSLGGADGLFDATVAHTEAVLARMNGEDPRFLTGFLMELLLEFKKGDPVKYAALAEKAAERAEAEGGFSFDRACKLWQIAAGWHDMAKNKAASEAAMIRSAETYAKDAQEHAARPPENTPNLQAAMRMERAVLALKKINTLAARARYQQLYPRLTEFQNKSRAELPQFSHKLDLTDGARFAEDQVSGQTLIHALQILGGLCKPASKAHLRQQAAETFRSPLMGFMGTTKLSGTGKVVARAPHFDSTTDGAEEATLAQMYGNAVLHRQCVAIGYILPAIRKIQAEHSVRLLDFRQLAASCPFVPPGRELTFAKGLYAGFTFDFIVSTHLLIPQIEHSIRLSLEAIGAIISGYDKQFRQNEYDLNTTLRMPELMTIFNDEDLIFDLRGLLTEHHGSNLRNEMAHGLLDDGQFHSEAAIYLWGLSLRLCMLRPREVPQEPDKPDNRAGEEK